MSTARLKMMDGAEVLAIPGVGVAMPGRDQQGRVIINTCVLMLPGFPPMPVAETFDSLEEKFGSSKPKISL